MTLDRIVIAVNFSEHSIAAAQCVARSLAPCAELVHVLEHPPPLSMERCHDGAQSVG